MEMQVLGEVGVWAAWPRVEVFGGDRGRQAKFNAGGLFQLVPDFFFSVFPRQFLSRGPCVTNRCQTRRIVG